MDPSTPQPSRREDFVKTLARAGAQAVRRSLPAAWVEEKAGRGNLVTTADRSSEREILGLLARAFPEDMVLTEESPIAVGELAAVPRLWVIDPLDGTNNFRFGRRYAAVSVAYVEAGVPRAAAVCDPFHDELFSAASGQGAFLNGSPIHVGNVRHLPSASVATDNGYDPAATMRNLELCLRIQPSPWILLRGSAVLSMCEVACDRTDLYFHTALQPWDNAAAFLIVREAGGRVVGLGGGDADFLASGAIVGNSDLVEQGLRYFQLP
jgi:myo-inositol-1(or 4)-monophosphatase